MCDMHLMHEEPYKVAIIDADLIGRKKHRFPNLVCMKLSGYWKEKDAHVELKTDYEGLEFFDKVYISKVFTDTPINESILDLENVEYGGTGFFYDKAPKLPEEIEHHMPDYHLYDDFVNQQIENGIPKSNFKYYTDYSIGFTTRGCFRQCEFCVNRNYRKLIVIVHYQNLLIQLEKRSVCLMIIFLEAHIGKRYLKSCKQQVNRSNINKEWMRDY